MLFFFFFLFPDSKRIVIPEAWGCLPNRAAEQQSSAWVSPRLFPCFTSACHSPRLVIFFLLVSHTNLQFVSLLHTSSFWISFPHTSLLQHLDSVFFSAKSKVGKKGGIDKKVRKTQRDPQWPNGAYARNCRVKCVQPLLPWWGGNMLWTVRVLCCQKSIQHFSKAHNLAKFGQIFLDVAKWHIPASKASFWQISNLYPLSWGMQALQK